MASDRETQPCDCGTCQAIVSARAEQAPPMASDRDQLWQLMHEHVNYWDHDHNAAVDAVIATGWRPPARVIRDPAELDTLPGRSIVVGHRGKFGTAYQLTSFDGLAGVPNWASPYDVEDRSTSREVIEREGSVTVLYEPTEEDGRG